LAQFHSPYVRFFRYIKSKNTVESFNTIGYNIQHGSKFVKGIQNAKGTGKQESGGYLRGAIWRHRRHRLPVRAAGQDNQEVKGLTAEFRRRFIAEFDSSNCGAILEALNEREGGFDCKKLTAAAAGLLSELLTEER
jgi:hypothetical protein